MKIIKQSWNYEYRPSYKDALKVLEAAARTCYKSEDKTAEGSAERLLQALTKKGHHSILEHISISVRLITDRAVTHELVRHRIGVAYSQESQRYVAYKNDVEFILPTVFYSTQPKGAYDPWYNACEASELYYQELLRSGTSPQIARSVLPNSTKTEIVVTANIREWRHIFNLRCSKQAHPQIRNLMLDLLAQFSFDYPVLFEDIYEAKYPE